MTTFQDLELHDATLLSVSVSWATREAEVVLKPCTLTTGESSISKLRWTGCSLVVIPHEAPWGRSLSISSHGCEGRRFWIEMQSGDLIELWADGFEAE